MNVVIFSGTTEGRSFSRALAALGASVTVCVATELGAEEQGCADGITVRRSALTRPTRMPPRQRAISVRRQRRRELNITVCCAPPAPCPRAVWC